jgi:ABC-type spermidine/putrescine transport system permease subunit I
VKINFGSRELNRKTSPSGRIVRQLFGSRVRGARVSRVTLALYILVLAFFGLFFVLPIAIAVRGAFLDQTGALTLDYIREVFRNPVYLEGFTNALRLAVGSTLLAFSIAAPLAWISEQEHALGSLAFANDVASFCWCHRVSADFWPGRRC